MTLKDIAEATGFSSNTVSLALRNSPRLPEETREVILKAAARLKYAPNRIARSLASSATHTIGLVTTDMLNPTLTLAAHTIERELSSAGYAVMYADSDGDLDREKRAVELFLSYQVDGMLVYPAQRQHLEHFNAADKSGTPVLSLIHIAGGGLDTVTIDDRIGSYRAFCHLLELGHRHFAMIDGGQAIGNTDKMEGALQALRDYDLSPDAIAMFIPAGHSAAEGYSLMREIFGLSERPTAVFATTDSLALGALQWCRENDVDVPNELSIVGYDNIEYAAYQATPLTTVNYAADEISAIGVARLLERLRGKQSWQGPAVQLIEPELIVRQSTSRPNLSPRAKLRM
ncbi:MAG: LacI family DNA-binding transcriptional regulator [Silicimonas sp.]